MAPRKKTASPAAEFVKNSADIINQLMKSLYTPLARLASVQAYEAVNDRVSDLLGLSSRSSYSRNDHRSVIIEVGNNIKQATKSNEFINRFKRDRNGYTFTIRKKPTQGGEFTFSTALKTFPGSSVGSAFENNISDSDKLSILWAAMSAAGFSFTPSGDKFDAFFTPVVLERTDKKSKQKAADIEEIDLAVDDTTGIAGMIEQISDYSNHQHNQKTRNAAFNAILKYEVEVDSFGFDVTVTIRPAIELSLADTLIPYIAETDDKTAIDYLSYSWIDNAVTRATARSKGTKNLPAVDLRVTARKLRAVRERFNVAKARVNEDGFCINNAGLPMWVPNVDHSLPFMKSHSNFTVDEDGYFQHESVAAEWAAKIVMTDWFNDVLVYTDSTGRLAVQRLLGYIPLDASSEYVFLNSSALGRRVQYVIRDVAKVVDSVVTNADATSHLTPEYAKGDSYNAGRVTESFSTLYANFASRPLSNRIEPSDPDFRHDDTWHPLVKHLFGIEIEELPTYHRSIAAHMGAYLRAVTEKRNDITMAVMNRIRGVEYFLNMGKKLQQKWGKVRQDAKAEALKRMPANRLLSEIDVPNVDAGGNLKGFMPHQVKVLSDRATGANTGLVGVAAGGGKSLMQLVDVLFKLEKNPTWRPILVTKPRLVKGLISEFNFFSKGKVNVVSLRKAQLTYMARMLRINTAAALIKWVNSLPPNTIFVCGYTDFSSMSAIYEDLDVPNRVMMTDVGLPQFLHLLRIIGFEQVSLDESHIIKNMKSRRSRYAFSLLAQAENKMELSGTIVSNTAVDFVGQAYGLNPMIFGDDVEAFKDEYGISGGLIKSDDAAFRINERLNKFTQQSAATKEDWSFILPDLYDKQLSPQLTPKQAKFYATLMLSAELELKAKIEGMAVGGEDDDDEDEEENDARLMMAADASLAKAEQFMVAPDENKQYLSWSDQPTGADLVSPMVKAIDAELDRIYRDMGADHSNNKTAVFGIHKVASGHFMRHTKHKDICLHYRAGDEEIIRQFKSNPDKIVLVADSTSLREGENLQMLSHIFDMQATWAPGDFEQLISRMYRPDPKGVYNKDIVTHWWITPEHSVNRLPTVSTVKLARMISKAISNARLRYERDPRWREISWQFEDLELLKMNLKTIFHSDQRDLAPYHQAWEKFVRWEREINQEKRKQVAEQVEADNPGVQIIDKAGRILDRNLFTKLVMREAKSTRMLPGSKRVFTAWEPGAVPADIHGLSLSILGDDPIERGQHVVTEFGPGIVQNAGENQIEVELYGLRKVRLYRDRIAVPNGEGVAKLGAIITNATAWQGETFTEQLHVLTKLDPSASLAPKNRKLKPGSTTGTSVPDAAPKPIRLKSSLVRPKPIEEEEEVEDEDEVEEDDEALTIEDIYAYIFNGMPALVIADAPSGVENLGWNRVSPFTGLTFKDWTSAEKFLTAAAKKFAISNSKYDTLIDEMDKFKTGRAMKLTKRVTDAQARNFFLSTHRRLKPSTDGRERIDPYWIAIGTQVYLAFSKESHSTKVFTWIKAMVSKNAGSIRKPKEVPELHVNIFNSLSEAAADLKKLAQNFNIPEADVRQELRNIKEDIVALRGRHVRPSK